MPIEFDRDGQRWVLTASHADGDGQSRDADAVDLALSGYTEANTKKDDYGELLKRIAQRKLNHRFLNSSREHASALLEVMFDRAQEEVLIFATDLHEVDYARPRVIASMRRFLSRPGARLRVLLQCGVAASWSTDDNIEWTDPRSLEFRRAVGSYAAVDAHRFMVMDRVAFRFEYDHVRPLAVANFNEPAVGKRLAETFEEAFEMATPLGQEWGHPG